MKSYENSPPFSLLILKKKKNWVTHYPIQPNLKINEFAQTGPII